MLGFFLKSVQLSCLASKRFFFFFCHSASSLSKSIIYSRYTAWIGQILSAWAPLLCKDLKEDGNSCAEWMSSGGFEYVIGLLFSRGKTAVQWKALTLRSFVIWDSSRRKKKPLHITLLDRKQTECGKKATQQCPWGAPMYCKVKHVKWFYILLVANSPWQIMHGLVARNTPCSIGM